MTESQSGGPGRHGVTAFPGYEAGMGVSAVKEAGAGSVAVGPPDGNKGTMPNLFADPVTPVPSAPCRIVVAVDPPDWQVVTDAECYYAVGGYRFDDLDSAVTAWLDKGRTTFRLRAMIATKRARWLTAAWTGKGWSKWEGCGRG